MFFMQVACKIWRRRRSEVFWSQIVWLAILAPCWNNDFTALWPVSSRSVARNTSFNPCPLICLPDPRGFADGKTFPKAGDKLTMHYTGTLTSGAKFDSSVDRGTPFKFTIGRGEVIRGWDEGVIAMSLGEKAKLDISREFSPGTALAAGCIGRSVMSLPVR
jgi:hypothetical protein